MTKDEAIEWAVKILTEEHNHWTYHDNPEKADEAEAALEVLSGKPYHQVRVKHEGLDEPRLYVVPGD